MLCYRQGLMKLGEGIGTICLYFGLWVVRMTATCDADKISGSWFGLYRNPLYIPFHFEMIVQIMKKSQKQINYYHPLWSIIFRIPRPPRLTHWNHWARDSCPRSRCSWWWSWWTACGASWWRSAGCPSSSKCSRSDVGLNSDLAWHLCWFLIWIS